MEGHAPHQNNNDWKKLDRFSKDPLGTIRIGSVGRPEEYDMSEFLLVQSCNKLEDYVMSFETPCWM